MTMMRMRMMSKPSPLAAIIGLTTVALMSNATLADTGSLSFQKLDSDNDGTITPTEAQGVPELQRLWEQIDEDDSDTINRQEFSAIQEPPDPSTQRWDFDTLDQNNNGYITAIEAREAPRLQEMWSQIDDDNSGAIDPNEFDTFEGMADRSRSLLKQQRFDELDENRDGVISVGEVRRDLELRQIWDSVDADDSGAVDLAEFTHWAGAQEGTELLAQAPLFERMDEDGNGYITAVEGRDLPTLHRNWSQFDTDNSGAIDPMEFSAFQERLQQGDLSGDMNAQVQAPAFERLDEDNNGHITTVEGRELPMLHRNWSQFDTDNSGAIDRAEFSAFEERLRQGKGTSETRNLQMHEKAKQAMERGEAR